MGLSNSLDIFQHKIIDLFQGFEFICAYLDNLYMMENCIGNIM